MQSVQSHLLSHWPKDLVRDGDVVSRHKKRVSYTTIGSLKVTFSAKLEPNMYIIKYEKNFDVVLLMNPSFFYTVDIQNVFIQRHIAMLPVFSLLR